MYVIYIYIYHLVSFYFLRTEPQEIWDNILPHLTNNWLEKTSFIIN